ncbi:MAG: hypothetical protein EOP46_09010, partial [Sphingobacteriaceae bacterium]
MKTLYSFLFCFTLSVIITSCNPEPYDPIGNNKPVPVLKMDTKLVAMPGTGGELPVSINTNVDKIQVASLVPWLTGSYGDKIVSFTSPANTEDAVRESFATLTTQTGQTEAQATVRIIQGNSGMQNIFADMLRNELTNDWKVLKPNGEWKVEDNALSANSPGDVQSVMAYQKAGAETVRSSTKKFRLSVDVANPGNWSGIVFHATDDRNFFYIGLNINPESLFVIVDRVYEGNGSPMAMDPGNVLSADRSPYLRCEIVTTTEKPDEFTLNIYELKNSGDIAFNTDLAVIQKLAYTRTFNNNLMAGGGYAGVWGKVGG